MAMWRQAEVAAPPEWYDVNAYDSFMKRHLQHYGYYTGRNEGYRHSLTTLDNWEKNNQFDSDDSSDSEYENKALKKEQGSKWDEFLKSTQLVYNYQAGKLVPKLREPRQLYAQSKELGPQQAARWPIEIQVLPERVKHIPYVPKNPEALYLRTGTEKSPYIRGEEGGGRVIYSYEPSAGPFFIRSRVGGHRGGCQEAQIRLQSEDDTTLVFESRFESGNLAKAVQVGEYEYELWLRNDLYTNKHTQWFYFQVSNTRPNVNYRFTIVNLSKSDSLYNQGMRPLLYSEKTAAEEGVGWHRFANDINYYKNNLRCGKQGERYYYSLTWTFSLTHQNDTVYMAHCYPYTYTDLQDYILNIHNDPVKSKICKQRVLCRTLAGNLVYLLTITSPSNSPQDSRHKKAVVITSRVHPGETNASWMMKGFLDYLLGNSADAKLLRDSFVFKIVPMLNPDGVIVGNYRCSLAGRDLNRNYRTVLKDSFPPVWYTKQMIRKLQEEREVILYTDLHGHSRKQNVFIYGCENKENADLRLRERVFPVMLGKNASDKFSFSGCKFKVQKSKEGTGRVVVWRLGIMNAYTMEATFCGSTLGRKKSHHFSTADYESMGFHFCDTLLDYCDPDPTKCANIICELEERLRREIMLKLVKQGENVELDDVHLSDDCLSAGDSSDSGGSDSSGSDGLPVHLQFMTEKIDEKKKKLKSRKDRDQQRAATSLGKHTSAEADRKPENPHRNCKHSPTPVKPKVGATPPPNTRATLQYRQRSKSKIDTHLGSRRNSASTPEKTEYLEALTQSYLKSGNLGQFEGPQVSDIPYFRYSMATNSPTYPEHMCTRHEQSFAQNYVERLDRKPPSRQTTYPQDLILRDSVSMNIQNIRLRDRYELLERPWSSLGDPYEARKFSSRQSRASLTTTSGNKTGDQLNLEVRPTQRHLLELAVAQQRQQDFIQMEIRKQVMDCQRKLSSTPVRQQQHPAPFDNLRTTGAVDTVTKATPCDAQPVRLSSSLSNHGNQSSPIATNNRFPQSVIMRTKSANNVRHGNHSNNNNNSNRRDVYDNGYHDAQFVYDQANHSYQKVANGHHSNQRLRSAKSRSQSQNGRQSMQRQSFSSSDNLANVGRRGSDESACQNDLEGQEFGRKPMNGLQRNEKFIEKGECGTENGYETRPENMHMPAGRVISDGSDENELDIGHTLSTINQLSTDVRQSAKHLSPTTGEYIESVVRETEDEVSSTVAEIEGQISRRASARPSVSTAFNDVVAGNSLLSKSPNHSATNSRTDFNDDVIMNGDDVIKRPLLPSRQKTKTSEDFVVGLYPENSAVDNLHKQDNLVSETRSRNQNRNAENDHKSAENYNRNNVENTASPELDPRRVNPDDGTASIVHPALAHDVTKTDDVTIQKTASRATKEVKEVWDPNRRTLHPVPEATQRSGPKFFIGNKRNRVSLNQSEDQQQRPSTPSRPETTRGLARSRTDPNLKIQERLVEKPRVPSGTERNRLERHKILAHRASESNLRASAKPRSPNSPSSNSAETASPTKISLIISHKHQDDPFHRSRFQPVVNKPQRPLITRQRKS